MQSEILDANFTTKDLVSLAKNYHYKVCNNEDCIIYKKSLVKPKTHFGFHIAGNINKFRYNDNLTTENIVSPSFGARFEMEKIVEWNQNISFVADINFYYLSKTTITPNDKAYGEFPVKYNGDTHVLSKNPVSTDTEDKLDVNLETIIISIPVSINYNFIQESGSLYFGFGFDNMFTQSKADLEISRANTATEYAKPLPKWIISPLCKAGYKYQTPNNNYIYCEIQFEKSVPMTPSLSASDYPTNTQTSLKLGFEF